jgi:integrative and conjugative element protein (TIGR02256 family)
MFDLWRRSSPVKIYISESAALLIHNECARVSGVETGGILLGYHSENWIVISHATGAGPRAVHERYNLELDLEYITKELKRYEKAFPIGYEGNWHCHPGQGFIRPSGVDESLQKGIVRSPNYDVDTVLLLITPSIPTVLADYHCFVFSSRWHSYRVAKPFRSYDPF